VSSWGGENQKNYEEREASKSGIRPDRRLFEKVTPPRVGIKIWKEQEGKRTIPTITSQRHLTSNWEEDFLGGKKKEREVNWEIQPIIGGRRRGQGLFQEEISHRSGGPHE